MAYRCHEGLQNAPLENQISRPFDNHGHQRCESQMKDAELIDSEEYITVSKVIVVPFWGLWSRQAFRNDCFDHIRGIAMGQPRG